MVIDFLKHRLLKALRSQGYQLQRIDYSAENTYDQLAIILNHLGIDNYIVFDVGAHHGESAQEFRKTFKHRATIYSFEPFPDSYLCLKDSVQHDSLTKTYQLAFTECEGKQDFHTNVSSATNSLLPIRSDATSRLQMHNTLLNAKSTISVVTSTVDKFCDSNEIKHVHLLKLDIQGGELKALKGAEKLLLSKKISLIYLELQFINIYEGQSPYYDICSFLGDMNYELFGFYDMFHTRSGRLSQADAIFVAPNLLGRLYV